MISALLYWRSDNCATFSCGNVVRMDCKPFNGLSKQLAQAPGALIGRGAAATKVSCVCTVSGFRTPTHIHRGTLPFCLSVSLSVSRSPVLLEDWATKPTSKYSHRLCAAPINGRHARLSPLPLKRRTSANPRAAKLKLSGSCRNLVHVTETVQFFVLA